MADNTEVILNIEGQILTCQKDILIKGSDYFSAMFESDMIETKTNEVFIKDVDITIMKSLIDCLVTGELKIDNNVEELLAMAVRFQMKSAMNTCEGLLLKSLDDGNCFELMSLASSLNLQGLFSRAKRHALYYFITVTNCTEFLDLDLYSVLEYLSDKELNCESELDVLVAIERWVNHSLADRETNLPQLLECFHVEDLDKDERVTIATNTILNKTEYGKKWLDKVSIGEIQVQNPQTVPKFREMPVTILSVGERLKPDGHLRMDVWKFCKTEKAMKPYTKFHCNPIGAKVIVIGKDFYLTGGQTNIQRASFVMDIWKFDGFERTWSIITVIPEPRRHHAACASKTSFYLLGGFGKFREVMDSVKEYNLENDSWIPHSNMMSKGYSLQSDYCCDKIFLCREKNIECLDLKKECWTKIKIDLNSSETISMYPVAHKQYIYIFNYNKYYNVAGDGEWFREPWNHGNEWKQLNAETMTLSSYPCNKKLCFGHKLASGYGKLYTWNYGTNTLVRTDLDDLTVYEELGTILNEEEHCSLVILPDYQIP